MCLQEHNLIGGGGGGGGGGGSVCVCVSRENNRIKHLSYMMRPNWTCLTK